MIFHCNFNTAKNNLTLYKAKLHNIFSNRKDEREFGMTVVYDSRKILPHPEFFEALQMVQVSACVVQCKRESLMCC